MPKIEKFVQNTVEPPKVSDFMRKELIRILQERQEEAIKNTASVQHGTPNALDILRQANMEQAGATATNPLQHKYPIDFIRNQFQGALGMPKEAPLLKERALSEIPREVLDVDIYRDDNHQVRKAKIERSVNHLRELFESVDRLYSIIREEPEYKEYLSKPTKYEKTYEDKKSRLELREIQIRYQAVQEIMEKLRFNPENGAKKIETEITWQILLIYAKLTGEIKGTGIAKRESERPDNEQKEVDNIRESLLSEYAGVLRGRYLREGSSPETSTTIHNR
jgi:hypothetical protein